MKLYPGIAEKYPRIQHVVEHRMEQKKTTPKWEQTVTEKLTMVYAGPNQVVWEFPVEQIHCNRDGVMQSGCVATLVDVCSNFAVFTHDGKHQWKHFGVSTTLKVSYLRGLQPNQTARVECDLERLGRLTANIGIRIYDQEGVLCYTGNHAKFSVDSRY
ncbi:hypothetical protein O0I10_002751 [Lichtheimia ornata]|uniref:Thioesterase domain-containing protein n=1 Tax=Lichtheimia ornata TaxID=688661 RepID=A0AAD7VAV8_9FUNG|nr:uncharacterized protein O0I10_002751 [Lichtheimia ornata]KAJ8661485.1 hypothetical protein O0I10_002751 [Lichtheimia ornata]